MDRLIQMTVEGNAQLKSKYIGGYLLPNDAYRKSWKANKCCVVRYQTCKEEMV